MSRKPMSRREFLVRAGQIGALATGASLAAACGAPAASPAENAAGGATSAPAITAAGEATSAPAAAAAGGEQIKLVMANYGAVPDAWTMLGAEFTKQNPNITIEFQAVQATTWGDYFDKLVTQLAGGTPPDIVRVAIEGTQLFAHRGLAISLDDFIKQDSAELEEYFADVNPNMVKSMAYMGQQYMLPFSWNGPVIHYNTKLFEEAGIERPADDWTKDQFLEIAKQLTKGDVYGFGVGNAYWGSAIPWIFVAGSNLLSEDWSQSTANAPNTVEAIQFMQDLIWTHKVAPNPAGADLLQMFSSGKLAMYAGGGNTRLAVMEAGLRDFDILYYPKWRTQDHEFGGSGFPILKTSKHPEAAWALTKFLIQRGTVASFVKAVAQTPARRSVAYEEWVSPGEPPEHFQIYYDMLDKPAKAVPAPPEYNEIESIFLRYLTLVTANEQTPQAAMDAAHEEISAVLANRTPPAS